MQLNMLSDFGQNLFGPFSVFPLRIIIVPFHSLIRLSLYPINYTSPPTTRMAGKMSYAAATTSNYVCGNL